MLNLINNFKKIIGRKSKKGFTLVELIVTLAVFSILMGLIVGILTPIMSANASARQVVEAKDVIDSINNVFENIFPKQKVLCLSEDYMSVDDSLYDGYIASRNGRLCYITGSGNGEVVTELLSDAVYGRYDMDMSFKTGKAGMLDALLIVTIRVYSDGYSTTRDINIRMSNIILQKANIIYPAGNPSCPMAFLPVG